MFQPEEGSRALCPAQGCSSKLPGWRGSGFSKRLHLQPQRFPCVLDLSPGLNFFPSTGLRRSHERGHLHTLRSPRGRFPRRWGWTGEQGIKKRHRKGNTRFNSCRALHFRALRLFFSTTSPFPFRGGPGSTRILSVPKQDPRLKPKINSRGEFIRTAQRTSQRKYGTEAPGLWSRKYF